MPKERYSFVVDQETAYKFRLIKEQLKTKNKNQTFIAMVSCFMKQRLQANLSQQVVQQVLDHREIWQEDTEHEHTDVTMQ
ncbi:MAG: hypothetical protein PVG65_00760 [Candidatus Thorarchaeota archaeon]|jgi:hypothetical protein